LTVALSALTQPALRRTELVRSRRSVPDDF